MSNEFSVNWVRILVRVPVRLRVRLEVDQTRAARARSAPLRSFAGIRSSARSARMIQG